MIKVEKITKIPIDKLGVDPANIQPKPDLTPEFVEDIRENGILHNLLVRPLDHKAHDQDANSEVKSSDEGEKYGVIVGARRLVAARHTGLEMVPCTIVEVEDDMEARAISVTENVHGENIPKWRWVEVIKEFYDATDGRKTRGKRVREVADKLNLSRRTVQRYLELDKLPEDFKVRLKEPRYRSGSEEKVLEESFQKGDARFFQYPTSDLKLDKQLPVSVAEKLARSSFFLELAKENFLRAHLLATLATKVGRNRVEEILKEDEKRVAHYKLGGE